MLEACRTGSRDEVLAALRGFRGTYLGRGMPPTELVDVLVGCADGLVDGRGDPAVALLVFYFDVLMYVPANLRTSTRGAAAPFVAAIEALTPRLLPLRSSADHLLAAWAWHLLSWMPSPVPGLADDALAALPVADRSLTRITLALAAASTPEGRIATTALLREWLGLPGEQRDVAAMVLAQLHGDPTRPEATPDDVHGALLDLAGRERWQEWEAAPAREHGYVADLAGCLVRAGYARAATTLPALLRLVDVASAAEREHVLDALLKIFYHSQPYPGEPVAAALGPAQRAALAGLVARPHVWAPRPRFFAALADLGLPLGAAPLAAFLGLPPPPAGGVVVTGVADGVLDVDTARSPQDLVSDLLR